MKSLAELEAIKKEIKNQVEVRREANTSMEKERAHVLVCGGTG